MRKHIDNIKQKFEEDPIAVITVAAATLGIVGALVNTITVASNSHTWRKEVNRRDRMTK